MWLYVLFQWGAWQTSLSSGLTSFWKIEVIESAYCIHNSHLLKRCKLLKLIRSERECETFVKLVSVCTDDYGLNKLCLQNAARLICACPKQLPTKPAVQSGLSLSMRQVHTCTLKYGTAPLFSAVSIPMNNQVQTHRGAAAPDTCTEQTKASVTIL